MLFTYLVFSFMLAFADVAGETASIVNSLVAVCPLLSFAVILREYFLTSEYAWLALFVVVFDTAEPSPNSHVYSAKLRFSGEYALTIKSTETAAGTIVGESDFIAGILETVIFCTAI